MECEVAILNLHWRKCDTVTLRHTIRSNIILYRTNTGQWRWFHGPCKLGAAIWVTELCGLAQYTTIWWCWKLVEKLPTFNGLRNFFSVNTTTALSDGTPRGLAKANFPEPRGISFSGWHRYLRNFELLRGYTASQAGRQYLLQTPQYKPQIPTPFAFLPRLPGQRSETGRCGAYPKPPFIQINFKVCISSLNSNFQ